ncbi:MAG: chalcone isomerase family protein, partial [Parachlamydiaceae bacterium]|nr:chalcone isomerase family protein [Parachlamydiaceae bacterium]
MILPKTCASYFEGFSELKDYSYNDRLTTLCALIKIFTYCTFVIPVSVYALSKLCDRFAYTQDLSPQAQRIDHQAQESTFGQRENSSDSKLINLPFLSSASMASSTRNFTKASLSGMSSVILPGAKGVEPKTLYRNGSGIRKKFMFQVYKASLWVENPSHDPRTLINSDTTKSIRLEMLRDVPGDKISGAIAEGFNSNSESKMYVLKDRLQK